MSRNLLSMNVLLAGLTATLMAATLAVPAHAASEPAAKEKRLIDFDSCAKPEYPKADLQAKHEGTVTLEFKLDPKGAVTDSKIVKSSGFSGLDEEARTAIAKCHFSAIKAGVTSEESAPVKYVWKLK